MRCGSTTTTMMMLRLRLRALRREFANLSRPKGARATPGPDARPWSSSSSTVPSRRGRRSPHHSAAHARPGPARAPAVASPRASLAPPSLGRRSARQQTDAREEKGRGGRVISILCAGQGLASPRPWRRRGGRGETSVSHRDQEATRRAARRLRDEEQGEGGGDGKRTAAPCAYKRRSPSRTRQTRRLLGRPNAGRRRPGRRGCRPRAGRRAQSSTGRFLRGTASRGGRGRRQRAASGEGKGEGEEKDRTHALNAALHASKHQSNLPEPLSTRDHLLAHVLERELGLLERRDLDVGPVERVLVLERGGHEGEEGAEAEAGGERNEGRGSA